MATKDVKDESKEATRVVSDIEGTSTKVVWDDSRMQTSYSNVCNVLGTREEIMLLFGANQAWKGGQKEVKVVLTDRIILNPYAAKRLLQLLGQGIREYETRYGELKL